MSKNDVHFDLVVANDAGGANILKHFLLNYKLSPQIIATGPAYKIFRDEVFFDDYQFLSEVHLEDAVKSANAILVGTGWASDIEKRAIVLARQLHRRCAAFLDHWVNYRERFELNGKVVLPNEIWVGDSPGFDMAKREFAAQALVILEENPYFRFMRDHVGLSSKGSTTRRILYCTEAIAEAAEKKYGDGNALGYTDESLLEEFLKKFPYKAEIELRLRPHPAEDLNKYLKIIEKHKNILNLSISISSLDVDLTWSTDVISIDSMVLAVAVCCERRAFSIKPDFAGGCIVPFPEIIPIWKSLFENGYDALESLGTTS